MNFLTFLLNNMCTHILHFPAPSLQKLLLLCTLSTSPLLCTRSCLFSFFNHLTLVIPPLAIYVLSWVISDTMKILFQDFFRKNKQANQQTNTFVSTQSFCQVLPSYFVSQNNGLSSLLSITFSYFLLTHFHQVSML